MAFDPLTGRWAPTMTAWPGYRESLGGPVEAQQEPIQEYWAARDPEEDWQRLVADLPADPRYAQGFYSMRPRLAGRYLLAEPYMEGARRDGGTEALPYGTSFAQYLSDFAEPGGGAGYMASTLPMLQQRARLAAEMARVTPGQIGGYAQNPEALAYYGMFGPEQQYSYDRQRAVAGMLAQQRQGGGAYRGRLGAAISRAVDSMARGRLAAGAPKTGFLDWYLEQTGAPQLPGRDVDATGGVQGTEVARDAAASRDAAVARDAALVAGAGAQDWRDDSHLFLGNI